MTQKNDNFSVTDSTQIFCVHSFDSPMDTVEVQESTKNDSEKVKNFSRNSSNKDEERQRRVIICMLTFGFIYVFHLIKESVIFLYDVLDEGQLGINESDIQFFIFCWISFLFFLVAGISILMYIWLRSHRSKSPVSPPNDKEE